MIHLLLQGGQGNQMFEYATALAIAEEYGHTICVDRSFFDVFGGREWCRPYGLDIFRLDSKAQYTHNCKLGVRVLPKLGLWCRQHGMQHLGPCFFELDHMQDIRSYRSVWLYGYFTNVHVFDRHAAAIRQAFTFKTEPNEANAAVLEKMRACNPVAVHIRRGDYLNAVNSGFAQNGVEWYQRAMRTMTEKVDNPHWFFFSDDMAWVKSHFATIENATFVDINHGAESYNDMRLMAACQHQIIANSTFSWWAAWLNDNPEKVVVAPHDYYREPQGNKKKYLDRMIPSNWIVQN